MIIDRRKRSERYKLSLLSYSCVLKILHYVRHPISVVLTASKNSRNGLSLLTQSSCLVAFNLTFTDGSKSCGNCSYNRWRRPWNSHLLLLFCTREIRSSWSSHARQNVLRTQYIICRCKQQYHLLQLCIVLCSDSSFEQFIAWREETQYRFIRYVQQLCFKQRVRQI